jgi:hypothetical protein
MHFVKESFLYALLFTIPLLVVLFGLPLIIRFWICVFKGKSALELTNEFLILNYKSKSYNWSDIKSFTFKLSRAYRSSPKGVIEISFNSNSERERIQLIQIDCESHELLSSLNYYLNKKKQSLGSTQQAHLRQPGRTL